MSIYPNHSGAECLDQYRTENILSSADDSQACLTGREMAFFDNGACFVSLYMNTQCWVLHM